MATTIIELKNWFLKGRSQGATHMIVACNTYDWIDFPIFVMSKKDVRKAVKEEANKDNRKIMEVYNLSKDIEFQLNKHRAMEF